MYSAGCKTINKNNSKYYVDKINKRRLLFGHFLLELTNRTIAGKYVTNE